MKPALCWDATFVKSSTTREIHPSALSGKVMKGQLVSTWSHRSRFDALGSENGPFPEMVNIQKTMERSTILWLGKSTISTGPLSIAMWVYQRVPPKWTFLDRENRENNDGRQVDFGWFWGTQKNKRILHRSLAVGFAVTVAPCGNPEMGEVDATRTQVYKVYMEILQVGLSQTFDHPAEDTSPLK